MATATTGARYDVIIAGGGMVGTSLALALAPLQLRVAIVEPVARLAATQPSFDDRSTALSRSSQRMFEAMGLWDSIAAAATPVLRIHVSDRGRFGFSHIDAEEQDVEALGYVVINRVLGHVLQDALEGTKNLEVICPAKIIAVRGDDNTIRASIEDESGIQRDVSGKLLVAADGANSAVREMMSIGVRREAYDQTAIVGNLLPEKPLENCAYERFTEHGPLALLPIKNGRAGFVWTVASTDAARVLDLADAEFLGELQDAFGYRLGTFTKVGKRAAYPLQLSKALRLTAPRTVLVGNAAHGLHPVAAQGFNLGLRDVAALCDCIAEQTVTTDIAGQDIDPGTAMVLGKYARWRHSDQKKLVGFTDGLVRLFGNSSGAIRALRNAGMLGFDLVPGVRSLVAKHTMGLAGKLPRLSRGVPLS